MPTKDETIPVRELSRVTDFESEQADYIQWKRTKIETALRHADEHPDDFITEKEIWNRYGLGY